MNLVPLTWRDIRSIFVFLWHLTPYTCSWQEEEEDDDWGEDTTEEAQRRRMDEISDHAKVLTLTDDLERTVEERVNILFDFVKVK